MIQPISQFTSNYYYRRTFKSSSNKDLLKNTQQEIKNTKPKPTIKSKENKNKVESFLKYSYIRQLLCYKSNNKLSMSKFY